ncbi:MAG: hypothetical protein H6822_01420 [Planctomycetaceae bacterium]|nr:hypothetical protein [Planctomycetales bacterium]MCB9920806.1 hypothetical protein [Planctomycetaceae bacterium]
MIRADNCFGDAVVSGKMRLTTLAVLFTAIASGGSGAELQYGRKVGEQFAYRVEISAEMADEITSYKGVTRYTIDEVSAEQVRMTYQGGLSESTKRKASSRSSLPFGPRFGPFGPGGVPSPFSRPTFAGKIQTTNKITMSRRGNVLALKGDSQLPFLLGNVSLLPFEVLSTGDKREWLADSGVSITQEQEGYRPFGRFGPFGGDDEKSIQAGSEKTEYVIESDSPTAVVIKKSYQLSSPKAGNQPAYEFTGTGTWTFNPSDGMPQASDFAAKLVVDENNTKTTIPISIKYHRLSPEEIAKLDSEAEQAKRDREMAVAKAKEAAEAPLTANERSEALAALRSGDSDKVLKSLERLGKKSPKEADPEVAATIQPLLNDPSKKIQEVASKTLAKWSPEYKLKYELNKAYDSHMPVKATGRTVTESTPLYVGQLVAAKLYASWFAAEILELRPDGKVLVRKRGFAPREHTLSRQDIQLAPDELDQPQKPTPLASTTPVLRTWSDATGKFKVEATFVKVADGKVTIRRTGGREVEVPIAKLSAEDQRFIEAQQAKSSGGENPFE